MVSKTKMKLVLSVLLILTISAVHSHVQCGNNRFCNVGFKPFQSKDENEAKIVRRVAEKLRTLIENNIIGIYNESSEISLIDAQRELCVDDTIGFILDENVFDYQISCVWTGSSQFSKCQAVPPQYSALPFYYVKIEEWTDKLEKVREALGCEKRVSRTVIVNNNTKVTHIQPNVFSSELFICNERCIQGGIGYIPLIVIIVTLAVSFFQNCVVVE